MPSSEALRLEMKPEAYPCSTAGGTQAQDHRLGYGHYGDLQGSAGLPLSRGDVARECTAVIDTSSAARREIVGGVLLRSSPTPWCRAKYVL